MAAALAAGPETPERHEVMQEVAYTEVKAAITRRNCLCISNMLLAPNTAYRLGPWNHFGVEPMEGE
jgi:hypothetical protein